MVTSTLPGAADVAAADGGRGGVPFLARLRRAWSEHRRYRRTLRELGSLSPRDLADIGIECHDLDAAARELCRR